VPRNNLFVFLANPRSENHPYAQYELPYLEDGAAIQIGFMQLIHGVAQQKLEQWRARMISSALHGAAANLRQMDAATASCEKVAKKAPRSEKRAANSEASEGRNSCAPVSTQNRMTNFANRPRRAAKRVSRS
jgi:hypothetical protein